MLSRSRLLKNSHKMYSIAKVPKLIVQKYAIKMLREDPDTPTELKTIQAVCRSNPNEHVVKVHDFWYQQKEEERFWSCTFIRMQLCKGTLEHHLSALRQSGRVTEPFEITEIMLQILTGLFHCHVQGYVHRDLKTSNSTSPYSN